MLHIFSIPCITTQLLQFEPTYASNFIKVSVLQKVMSCMFRASQVHHQGAHDCTKQYFSTVEPRTQAGLLTVVIAQLYYINITQWGVFGKYIQKTLSDCFVQLCAPWRWTSEARNLKELVSCNIVTLIKLCAFVGSSFNNHIRHLSYYIYLKSILIISSSYTFIFQG